MAIDADVLVIGSGLAGHTAAIAAADAGAKVRLVSANQSTLRQASGLIDVLGYEPRAQVDPREAVESESGGQVRGGNVPTGRNTDRTTAAGDGPLVDPFEAVEDLPAGHPYERVGVEAVREGLELFDRALGDAYAGEHTDANALVPTHGGTVKPTARYPATVADGLASDERDALLVGFSSVTGFEARMAAAHLRDAEVPFDVEGVSVEFPGELRPDARINRYADAFDSDEVPGGEDPADSCRAAVAERIEAGIDAADIEPQRIGLPAILGEGEAREVVAELEARVGLPVFEVPTSSPSVPGMRLEGRLRDELNERGVRAAVGRPVVDYDAAEGGGVEGATDDGWIETVEVQHSDAGTVPWSASQYVLATGGLVGRGVDSTRDGVAEPIFDCHVPEPEDRYDWFADEVYGAHPFPRFGVVADRELRPLDADGEPEFANLRAAGSVLGGYDFAAEKSGSGVSIATGYAAGTAAAEEV